MWQIDAWHEQYFERFQLATLSPYGLTTFKLFLFVPLKNSLVGMYNMNGKDSKVKFSGRMFPESSNGKLSYSYNKFHACQIFPQGNTKTKYKFKINLKM